MEAFTAKALSSSDLEEAIIKYDLRKFKSAIANSSVDGELSIFLTYDKSGNDCVIEVLGNILARNASQEPVVTGLGGVSGVCSR